jgi:hypothetical protein
MTDHERAPRGVAVHPATFAIVTLYRDEDNAPTGTYGEVLHDLSMPLTSGEVARTLRLIADAVEARAEARDDD